MQVKSSPTNIQRKIIYDLLVLDQSLSLEQLIDQTNFTSKEIRNALEFFRYHEVVSAAKQKGPNGKYAGSLRVINDVFTVI